MAFLRVKNMAQRKGKKPFTPIPPQAPTLDTPYSFDMANPSAAWTGWEGANGVMPQAPGYSVPGMLPDTSGWGGPNISVPDSWNSMAGYGASPMLSGEVDPMAAMTDAGGPSFEINPTMWDKIKQGGSDLAGSFMPKINPETGKMETMGWGMPVLQGLSSLGNLYLGMKNYGLAKDQLRTQKDQFNRNYENQKQLLNTRMEDIQRTEAGGSSKAESVESYMARNRIK